MERTIYMLVAYDGSDFHGWQTQLELRTVQGVVEGALRRVVRHPIDLIGTGRTDAGVHAAGHVSHFVTTCQLPTARMRHAIGSRLPKDIAILALREVHPQFNARRSTISKLYRYRIHNAPGRPVERRSQRYTYHVWHPLDLDRMRAATPYFLGRRDFSAMAAAGCRRESMIREVLRCDAERHLDEIRIDVEGTGFLHKQVRNMVGTLIDVAQGRWDPKHVEAILESRKRSEAGPTAPARGLCFQWVRYPPHLLVPPNSGQLAETAHTT